LENPATIFALSTPRGRGAVGIIRISGPAAGDAVRALIGKLPPPRRASLARIRHPSSAELLDRALCLWFPAPGSYTGEDLAEFHVHGGPAVVSGVLEALADLPGLVPAEPGAFSRRAFEHGRLDLTAAEGIADLIEAETAAQRRVALAATDGRLAELVERWRTTLLQAMALIEAEIDFPDEDLGDGLRAQARVKIEVLHRAIAAHRADATQGERLRVGFRVALLGEPNVGKSSLLNAIAQREVAIVTDLPGTTRDVLEVHLDLGGYPVILADMAGLREAGDPVEAIGIARAKERAQQADLRLLLVEAVNKDDPLPAVLRSQHKAGDLVVLTKADLSHPAIGDPIATSSQTGEGIATLLAALEDRAAASLGGSDSPLFSRVRHRRHLQDCISSLEAVLGAFDGEAELLAEDLRRAADALGRLTGRIDAEEVLGSIFAEFCIGK